MKDVTMPRLYLIVILFLFVSFQNLHAQHVNQNKVKLSRIDSLINAHRFNEVVLDLNYLDKNNLKKEEIPLYAKFIEALEKANYNDIALQNSLGFLKKDYVSNHLKSKLYIINARLYEKAGNKINTKKSLNLCISHFDKNTPEEIRQEWHVRMASY